MTAPLSASMAATAGPTPMWYATRGSGFTALVLISLAVMLGLLTSVRWTGLAWPRFLSQALHRTVSLLAVVFLLIHILTSVLDPFARLGLSDALVPFDSQYRPLWLGLGVIAFELFLAVLVTSLVRQRLSFGVWRVVHLLSYASWPFAVLHGLGTGTDTRSPWALLLVLACVAGVAATLIWRLAAGRPRFGVMRGLGITASAAAVIALGAWTASGPLQPGWARSAGTPADLLAGAHAGSASRAATRTPAPLSAHLDDHLTGTLQRSDISATATLDDTQDRSLRLVVVASPDGAGSLTVTRNGRIICATRAVLGTVVTASCGTVNVDLVLFNQGSGNVSGTLTTRPAS